MSEQIGSTEQREAIRQYINATARERGIAAHDVLSVNEHGAWEVSPGYSVVCDDAGISITVTTPSEPAVTVTTLEVEG